MKLSNEEIAAKDLRVGNKVFCNGECWTVEGIDVEHVALAKGVYDIHVSHLRPIQLMPEILERCGAFDTNGTYQLKIYSDTLYIVWHPKQGLGIRVYKANGGYIDHNFKTQYVHQFQNLYHALAGEELPLDIGIAISKNEVK